MSNNSMTSEPTTPNHIQPTLFVVDSLANQSQTQASAKGSQRLRNLVCGTNSTESFAYYSLDTSSWKTCQQSFLEDLESYSETWPRQGITVNGVAYQHRMLEPVIKEIVGGSLPTPCSRDYKDSGESMNYKKAAEKGRLPGVMVESRLNKTGKDTYLNPRFVEEMMGYPIGYTEIQESKR